MRTLDTKIWVNHDYSIDVSEATAIDVAAAGELQRDLSFPGRKLEPRDVYMIGADVNGGTVNAEVAPLGDGMRIRVRPSPRHTPPTRRPGMRLFEINYRVLYKAVGDDNDSGKLEWPLTSAGDRLPLRGASLRVTLPEETPSDQIHAQFQLDGMPVAEGEHQVSGTRVSFRWDGVVAPGQVLRAVVTFPRVEAAPFAAPPKGLAWMFNATLWLVVFALYYLVAKVFLTGGGDGKPVIVEYEPPAGWSAGAVRLLWHGSWDGRCLATGVLGIAAKGGLTLGKQDDGVWVATRTGDEHMPTLTADERRLRSALFTFGHTAAFSGTNADSIGLAELAYQRVLEERCARERPLDPVLLLIPGWLIALPAATLLFLGVDSRFAMIGQIFVPGVVGALALAMLMERVPLGILRATRAQAFFVAAICAAGLFGGGDRTDWLAGAALLAGQVAAGWWLPRQRPRDTPLLRKLRGFRWYLGTAEQQEMDARYKPSLHPELQASLLPYAMALDVEVSWNAHFAQALAEAAMPADFVTSLNPDHDQAALDLLDFAQSLARQVPR